MRVQVTDVSGEVGNLVDAHAPRDAAEHGRALVVLKVVARLDAQLREDVVERLLAQPGVFFFRLDLNRERPQRLSVRDDLGGNLRDGEDVVNQPRRNRVARHIVELGLVRILHESDAAHLLDALQTHRAVCARARQDDADGVRVVRFGQRPEEDVDGRAPLLEAHHLGEREMTVVHRQTLIRRDDVDMIRLDADALRHLRHGDVGGDCRTSASRLS